MERQGTWDMDDDDIRLGKSLVRLGVPNGIAHELEGLASVVGGAYTYAYEITPTWDIWMSDRRVEIYAEINRVRVTFERSW